jgi:dienelactone hydrolase
MHNHHSSGCVRPSSLLPMVLSLLLLFVCSSGAIAQAKVATYQARDSVRFPVQVTDDQKRMLDGIRYKPASFTVEARSSAGPGDAAVTFPSPRPCGDAMVDRVSMEWYAARDEKGQPLDAPAVLIIHELDGGMRLSRLVAKNLAKQGLHAFVMHLPGFGERWSPDIVRDAEHFVTRGRQGIADARRARDAIAVLPHIDTTRISIQGTSLGGYVTSITAAIDDGFSNVFIFLAGGGLENILASSGGWESIVVWQVLNSEGFTVNDLGTGVLEPIEPMRLASRLPADKTWIISASADKFVRPEAARALATEARLPAEHQLSIPGDHLTCIVNLQTMVDLVARTCKQPAASTADASGQTKRR